MDSLTGPGPTPVHPRLCGEHPVVVPDGGAAVGSSPPVRGTPVLLQHRHPRFRFIPACAGNTTWPRTCCTASPVHPRLCGEHDCPGRGPVKICGSSPPVRGTPPLSQARARSQRFIPACAGNTGHYLRPPFCLAVHPRLCGEHLPQLFFGEGFSGSSPPVRGTHGRGLDARR